MRYNLHVPVWLEPLMGEREKLIACANDATVMQCLPWGDEERLPSGQCYVVSKSLRQWFVVDGKRKQIIG